MYVIEHICMELAARDGRPPANSVQRYAMSVIEIKYFF